MTARESWRIQHRAARLAAKAPGEHVVSVEIMCFALSRFFSGDPTSEVWLSLAPFGRWLTFWRRLGEELRPFKTVAFPIIRRVFAGLIANELVRVQPMSLPSGLLFYMDYGYDSKEGSRIERRERPADAPPPRLRRPWQCVR